MYNVLVFQYLSNVGRIDQYETRSNKQNNEKGFHGDALSQTNHWLKYSPTNNTVL
jgi:hypothetical protein